MRIIAGEWRGRLLETPGSRAIRPTSDRVREALFSILTSRFGNDWHTTRVADLCAGTGALGLEALSRGAAHCIFVEKDAAALRLLEKNIAALGAGVRAKVVRADVTQLPVAAAPVDLILIDPPYRDTMVPRVLETAVVRGWIADTSLCVAEQPAGTEITAEGWACSDIRRYGKTQIMLFERAV